MKSADTVCVFSPPDMLMSSFPSPVSSFDVMLMSAPATSEGMSL